MMPGIYENSNRFGVGGKPRGKCWRLGKNNGENEKREERADGESDKNAIVPEDKNIRCVMKGGEEKG